MLAINGHKKCSGPDCGLRPVADFGKSASRPDGLQHYCKECRAARQRRDYVADRSKYNARSVVWQKKNPSRAAVIKKRCEQKRKYSMQPGEFERRQAEQRGLCASCGSPGKLVIDHDHTSGKVRGLLCSGCNIALGHLRDNAERAYKLAEYAAVHGPRIALEAR